MRRGTLNFCAFIMVPKMENKLGFIQIICSLWLFDQCGSACNHKIGAGIATNIYDMDV